MNTCCRPTLISLCLLLHHVATAAPGEIAVSVESSPDQAVWGAGAPGVVDVSVAPSYFRAVVAPADGGDANPSDSVLADTTHAGKRVSVVLESSADLVAWQPDTTGTHDVTGAPKFFKVRTETSYDNFVEVQGGTFDIFIINDANNNPIYQTTTLSTYHIGKYEVTLEEWQQVRAWALDNGYTDLSAGNGCAAGDHPVTGITWFDVVKWCNARSEMEGREPVYYTDDSLGAGFVYRTGAHTVTNAQVKMAADGYRLPTDAEFEFAARGGTLEPIPVGYTYSGSDDPDDVAWYILNSSGAECDLDATRGTWPVGQKLQNDLGLHDMSGNVMEWCWDAQGARIAGSVTDPMGPNPTPSLGRTRRGGSWSEGAFNCTNTFRTFFGPGGVSNNLGFRVAFRQAQPL